MWYDFRHSNVCLSRRRTTADKVQSDIYSCHRYQRFNSFQLLASRLLLIVDTLGNQRQEPREASSTNALQWSSPWSIDEARAANPPVDTRTPCAGLRSCAGACTIGAWMLEAQPQAIPGAVLPSQIARCIFKMRCVLFILRSNSY